MSRIEGQFLKLALEIGLAQTIAETLKDVDRAIAELPDRPSALRCAAQACAPSPPWWSRCAPRTQP